MGLVADVAHHDALLRHTVLQLAVDEDRKCLAMLTLKAHGVALGRRDSGLGLLCVTKSAQKAQKDAYSKTFHNSKLIPITT